MCGYAYLGKDCACLVVVLVPVFTAVRIRVRIRRMGKDCAQALMPCIMAGMDQRYLFMVVHTPVVCNDICLWFRLHTTVESPQFQSFLFIVILVVAQIQILMVLHHRVSPAAVH